MRKVVVFFGVLVLAVLVQGHALKGEEEELQLDQAVAASHHGHHHESGGGHEGHEHHHESHGGKGDKGYHSHHHHDKGGHGKHGKHHSAGHHAEKGGHHKSHHESGGHHSSHHAHGGHHKGGKFGEKKGHKKGQKTKGYHVKAHKDEYHKKHKFYDDAHKGGHHEKHGSHHGHHGSKAGHHKKGGSHKSGYHDDHFGKKGFGHKGHYDEDHKGYKGHGGHENHHSHHSDYGKKGGHEGHSSHDTKTNIIRITTIENKENEIFAMPHDMQNISYHEKIQTTAAFQKVKRALTKRGTTRKVWIADENILKVYMDKDGNIQFNDFRLEQQDILTSTTDLNQQLEIEQLINKYKSEFAKDKYDVGTIRESKAHIDLIVDKYCSKRPYRCTIEDRKEIESQIQRVSKSY
ncbi:unnamed protein product [Diabrotica balteata]|uniref:Uncharacterized protein n=1 Tax=Diabrotica balteata TaxID=107213 RepID=A0A9N9XB49_DIABA|nr:unnamed protein product [Diabrotica balteata]